MIQIIAGKKGKGKTKYLLEKVNAEIKTAHGSIVYLDKSTKHMYELNNKIRLIDTSAYPITNSDEFIGFICGILSQDNDLEQMYLDSFLKIAQLEGENESKLTSTMEKLEKIGESYKVNFVLSISLDEVDLPEQEKSKVIVSL
ncbi:MAG: twitching motility protein PilT [Lachnospiraceae bacterium]|nr:twitching motility protein PilT [Robinsoniella sp.]MDY3765387.1 twitching motility protein PilT [Lachnospiraceae bacterium]